MIRVVVHIDTVTEGILKIFHRVEGRNLVVCGEPIDKIDTQSRNQLSATHIQASSLPSAEPYSGKSENISEDIDSIEIPIQNKEIKVIQAPKWPDYRQTQRAKIIHINTATLDEWQSLYNVGPYRAGRIINFRDALGGFYSVDQVGETYGLPDSVFQEIKPNLKVDSSFKKIYINEIVYDSLYQHPYITKQMAYFIVKHRESKKSIQNIDELFEIIQEKDHKRLKKLEPYLFFDIR